MHSLLNLDYWDILLVIVSINYYYYKFIVLITDINYYYGLIFKYLLNTSIKIYKGIIWILLIEF